MSRSRLAKVLGVAAVTAAIAATAMILFDSAPDGGDRRAEVASAALDEGETADPQTLSEIAAAASGKPGEQVPPCPEPDIAQKLKEAGIPFGPCDPIPEPGEVVILPEASAGQPSDEGSSSVVCLEIEADRGPTNLDVRLPCGKGAKLLEREFVTVDGQTCVRVSYLPSENAEALEKTFCGKPFND